MSLTDALGEPVDLSGWTHEIDSMTGQEKWTAPDGKTYHYTMTNTDWTGGTTGGYTQPYTTPFVSTPTPTTSINIGVNREQFETCAACGSDCEWVLCDVCKLALVQLRDKVLLAIAKTIEDDLS